MDDALLDKLQKALFAAIDRLVERAEDGTITAADITHLRALYKEAGGELMSFQGRPTELGDEVLASLATLDLDMLN